MHPFIAKTFGGLSPSYYFRQFVFGLIFPALILAVLSNSHQPFQISLIFFIIVSGFLYPYSRFVYERIVEFIMGGNVFFVNAIMMLGVKFGTMTLCYCFSIFIAPVGLIYLYFYHSKNSA